MFIYVVRNARKKLILLTLSIVIWLISFYFTKLLFEKNIAYNITINQSVRFSHPYSIKVKNVFFRDGMLSVETTAPGFEPITKEFDNHLTVDKYFTIKYPSVFTVTPKEMLGGEILYHIDFSDRDNIVHGFVQVWNLSQPLDKFLEESVKLSSPNLNNLNVSNITVDNVQGYLWKYTTKENNLDKTYCAYEAFLKKGDLMYRLSYFIPSSNWTKEKEDIFVRMLNSFRFK